MLSFFLRAAAGPFGFAADAPGLNFSNIERPAI